MKKYKSVHEISEARKREAFDKVESLLTKGSKRDRDTTVAVIQGIEVVGVLAEVHGLSPERYAEALVQALIGMLRSKHPGDEEWRKKAFEAFGSVIDGIDAVLEDVGNPTHEAPHVQQ